MFVTTTMTTNNRSFHSSSSGMYVHRRWTISIVKRIRELRKHCLFSLILCGTKAYAFSYLLSSFKKHMSKREWDREKEKRFFNYSELKLNLFSVSWLFSLLFSVWFRLQRFKRYSHRAHAFTRDKNSTWTKNSQVIRNGPIISFQFCTFKLKSKKIQAKKIFNGSQVEFDRSDGLNERNQKKMQRKKWMEPPDNESK